MTIWKLEKIRKIQETIMSKVFVIPDVHLKTWMFKRATEFLQKGDYSPIWVRPQEGAFRLYPWDMMQVVGHTPVEAAQLDGKLLFTPTSLYYT